MKTSMSNTWKPIWTLLFTAAVAFGAAADDATPPAAPASAPEKSFTGTVVSLNANEHLLRVNGWFFQKRAFNLGDNCVYSQPGNDNATVNSFRPGEKVKVSYQDRHGVLIADRVEQIPMRVEGTITALNPAKHTLTVRGTAVHREFQLPADCQIELRGDKTGTLDDIKTGDYVTVTYETPNDTPTAREIAQTSQEFSGSVTAIDLDERTVKAKTMLGSKEFHLADNCAIMVNGQPNGRLADLRPEEKVVFNYDDINGVNVVNRIAPESSSAPSAAQGRVATTGQGY